MKRNRLIPILLVLIALSLCGCWDAKDLEELSIPIVAAYDLEEKAPGMLPKYMVTGLYPNFDPDAKSNVKVEGFEGITIASTRTSRVNRSPKPIVFGMLQALVFGKDLSESGLAKVTDIYNRMPDIKGTVYMCVAKGRADKILKQEVKNYSSMGTYLLEMLHNSHDNSFIPQTTLASFMISNSSPGKNPVLPLVQAVDESSAELAGACVFKKDKLFAMLDIIETRSLVLLRGISSHGYIDYILKKDGKVIDIGTVFAANSRKVRLERNGSKFTFFIDIKLKCKLIEHQSETALSDSPKFYTEVEKQIEKSVTGECESFIKKILNEYKFDCIDITKYALAKYRSELAESADTDFMKNVDIKVNVKASIITTQEIK